MATQDLIRIVISSCLDTAR